MQIRLLNFFKYYWIKVFSVFLFILLFGAYVSTFATFSGNPYIPGATLDPECAPTDTNCKVSASPWLTSSSSIYHNGNVNVGNDTASISSSMGGESSFDTSTLEVLNTDSLGMIPSITLNNDGNPVIVYYTTAPVESFNFIKPAEASGDNSSLNIIVCSDPECTTSTSNVIDSGFYADSNLKISVKIDSNNLAHIAYMEGDDDNIKYAVCNDEECSDPDIETIAYGNNGWDYVYSLSLDETDHPYIIYNSADTEDTWNYIVSLARYTGSGTEDTCISSYYQSYDEELGENIYTYETNINWKCTTVAFNTNQDLYLDYGVGDFMFLNSSGYPRFIAESEDYGTEYTAINYYSCNNVDCTNPTRTVVDSISIDGDNVTSSLAVNSDGVPYIFYGDNSISDIKLAYLNTGSGSGCSESSDWTCTAVALSDESIYDYYLYSDMKIGSDDIPRMIIKKIYDDGDTVDYLEYIKCSDTICSSSTTSTIFSESDNINYANDLSSQIVLSSDDSANFAYIDTDNQELKFTKEIVSEDIDFDQDGDDFFTFGDVGIRGNLFTDGQTVLGGGLYLSDNVPDDISNTLYNDEGDLYWNGTLLNQEYTPQWANSYTYGGITLTMPGTSGTIATTNGSVNYATSAGSASSASSANQLTTTRSIYGNNFNGTANLTQIISATYGGTGNAYTSFTGPTTSTKTFTLPNASATILTSNEAVTVAQGGTGLATLTANNLMVGNGTGNVTFIAPGTTGNVLTSNGTTWASTAPTLVSNANYNTLAGTSAGLNLVTGAQYNSFLGYEAGIGGTGTNAADYNIGIGYRPLYANTSGNNNISIGSNSLLSNTSGNNNVAIGNYALSSNITGFNGVAIGYESQRYNYNEGYIQESFNTSVGYQSLRGSTTPANNYGNFNSSLGYQSLYSNTSGESNDAFGSYTMFSNTTGNGNSGFGSNTLYDNTTGSYNSGFGMASLASNNGNNNSAFGYDSLSHNTTGTYNIALGDSVGNHIANGSTANTTGDYNIFIGSNTKALADNDQNEIVIGYNATGNGSNTTTIGTGNVLYVGGSSISGKVARFTNSAGYCDINPNTTSLTCSSDINLKKNIKTLDTITNEETDLSLNKENVDFVLRKDIEIPESILGKINLLTPVTYNWNTEEYEVDENGKNNKHIGFIAQEVEQIFPDLVFTDKDRIDPITKEGLKSIAYSNLIPYTIKAIQEMNLVVKDLSSLDIESATSLGSMVKSFLEDIGNGIDVVFFGEVRTKKLCLDDLCIDKEQLQQILDTVGVSGEEEGLDDIPATIDSNTNDNSSTTTNTNDTNVYGSENNGTNTNNDLNTNSGDSSGGDNTDTSNDLNANNEDISMQNGSNSGTIGGVSN